MSRLDSSLCPGSSCDAATHLRGTDRRPIHGPCTTLSPTTTATPDRDARRCLLGVGPSDIIGHR